MYSLEAITLDRAAAMCPALVQSPHSSRSDKYEHIPTIDVLRAIDREGFAVHGIACANTRDETRRGYTKHMLRLRRAGDLRKVGDIAPEVVLVNSHDGSCAYRMDLGMVRLVCKNGMVAGGKAWQTVSVPHKGADTIGKVIEGTYSIVDGFPKLIEAADTMRAITLNRDEQHAFASAALTLRYPEAGKGVAVQPERILRAQRREDVDTDLWTTFNRVQEHLIRGGARGLAVGSDGRPRRATVRAVNSIDGNVSLNKALWQLSEEMARLKSAA